MKIANTKVSVVSALYAFIIIVWFLYVINTGPIFHPDSQGYIDMAINRSIGYPAFIAVHKWLFGIHCFTALVISQFALLAVAGIYFVKSLKNALSLHKWAGVFIFLIILSPVVYELKTANSVTSESLAYPLYLIVLYHLLNAIKNKQHSSFLWSFAFLFALLCVRGQFLFMLPVTALLILFEDSAFNIRKPKVILLAGLFVTTALSLITDIVFHKSKHGYAVTTPWTGIQIATLPFFVSNSEDAAVFGDQQQKDYFNHVYRELSEKKLLLSEVPKETEAAAFYYDNYVDICNGTINRNGEDFFINAANKDEKTILNDHITSAMAIPLLLDNFSEWSLIYVRNVFNGFATLQNLLAFFAVLLFSAVSFIKSRKDETKVLIFFCLLLFGNVLLVALVEPVLNRYVFYNNWILITILLFLFQRSFQKQL